MHAPTHRRSVLQAVCCIAASVGTQFCFARPREAPGHIRRLILAPEPRLDIGDAALRLAAELYSVDTPSHLGKLDELGLRVRARMGGGTITGDSEVGIGALVATLFRDERFAYDHSAGAHGNYLNALLHGVLERKLGTCMGLPTLCVAVAQRAGLPVYTVAAPDHVFARYHASPPPKYANIECTSGGKYLPDSSYIHRFRISQRGLDSGAYMRTLSHREHIASMFYLNSLMFHSRGDYGLAVWYMEGAVEMGPRDAHHHNDAALMFESLASFDPRRWGGLMSKARQMQARALELGYVPIESVRNTNGIRGTR